MWSAYRQLDKAQLVGCWAHVRRKFFEATPKKTDKRHELDAEKYMTYLLEHLPNEETLAKKEVLEAYLPWEEKIKRACKSWGVGKNSTGQKRVRLPTPAQLFRSDLECKTRTNLPINHCSEMLTRTLSSGAGLFAQPLEQGL
nr:Transposase [Streptococcus suis]